MLFFLILKFLGMLGKFVYWFLMGIESFFVMNFFMIDLGKKSEVLFVFVGVILSLGLSFIFVLGCLVEIIFFFLMGGGLYGFLNGVLYCLLFFGFVLFFLKI